MKIGSVHRWVGLATVAAFLGTGVYMRMNFPEAYGGNETIHVLYRTNHIYLLASGLLNVALGVYLVRQPSGWRRRIQTVGSFLVLGAPFILMTAFITEAPDISSARHLTTLGILSLTTGTFMQFPARVGRRESS
jgi:hypothetical protein